MCWVSGKLVYVYPSWSVFDEEQTPDIFESVIIATVNSAGRPSPGRGESLQAIHIDE